jgi:hypothetical protein
VCHIAYFADLLQVQQREARSSIFGRYSDLVSISTCRRTASPTDLRARNGQR